MSGRPRSSTTRSGWLPRSPAAAPARRRRPTTTSYWRAVRLIRSARRICGSSSTISTRVTPRPRSCAPAGSPAAAAGGDGRPSSRRASAAGSAVFSTSPGTAGRVHRRQPQRHGEPAAGRVLRRPGCHPSPRPARGRARVRARRRSRCPGRPAAGTAGRPGPTARPGCPARGRSPAAPPARRGRSRSQSAAGRAGCSAARSPAGWPGSAPAARVGARPPAGRPGRGRRRRRRPPPSSSTARRRPPRPRSARCGRTPSAPACSRLMSSRFSTSRVSRSSDSSAVASSSSRSVVVEDHVVAAQAGDRRLGRGQRGAQVVADRGEQRGAQPVGLGQRPGRGGLLGEPLLAQRDGGLRGERLDHPPVGRRAAGGRAAPAEIRSSTVTSASPSAGCERGRSPTRGGDPPGGRIGRGPPGPAAARSAAPAGVTAAKPNVSRSWSSRAGSGRPPRSTLPASGRERLRLGPRPAPPRRVRRAATVDGHRPPPPRRPGRPAARAGSRRSAMVNRCTGGVKK